MLVHNLIALKFLKAGIKIKSPENKKNYFNVQNLNIHSSFERKRYDVFIMYFISKNDNYCIIPCAYNSARRREERYNIYPIIISTLQKSSSSRCIFGSTEFLNPKIVYDNPSAIPPTGFKTATGNNRTDLLTNPVIPRR